MSDRLKVGVIGAGVIAQVMHLNYLRELSDRFEVVALCDISGENADNNADRYNIGKRYTDWREMLDDADIDAVFILTSGSHAPIAIAAANAGKHVLVEKPMCFSVAEGLEMKAAADAAGVTLMVAYPKRYDPAFERFRDVAVECRGATADAGHHVRVAVPSLRRPLRAGTRRADPEGRDRDLHRGDPGQHHPRDRRGDSVPARGISPGAAGHARARAQHRPRRAR